MSARRSLRVAIIGAGPAGLTTLKYLLTAHRYFDIAPIEATLFESQDGVGGTFKSKAYEDAELVSSKYLTAFSDFRLPASAPTFLTPNAYCEYLAAYATQFDLWPHIVLGATVVGVRPCVVDGEGIRGRGHAIIWTSTDTEEKFETRHEWFCDAVGVCTGLHGRPDLPDIPGLDGGHCHVLHSSEFRGRMDFPPGGTVVVLGAGETAMDVVYLAATSEAGRIYLCHRQGFFAGPKVIPSPVMLGGIWKGSQQTKAVDCATASLFDTAYVPTFLQQGPLLWWYYDHWIKKMLWFISGSEQGPDQWTGAMAEKRRHVCSFFFTKSTRALAFLSAGKRSTSLANRLRTWFVNVPIVDTSGRSAETLPWPDSIDENGVMRFESSTSSGGEGKQTGEQTGEAGVAGVEVLPVIKPDVVVAATGYRADLGYIDSSYPTLKEANVRGICCDRDVTLGYIGFVRPSFGAIPPLAELQAQHWIMQLLASRYPAAVPQRCFNAVPPYELDYSLHSSSDDMYDAVIVKRGVDHESYAYQLAVDMGTAPRIGWVLKNLGWRGVVTWAMGPNFTTKFRLVGPWAQATEERRVCVNMNIQERVARGKEGKGGKGGLAGIEGDTCQPQEDEDGQRQEMNTRKIMEGELFEVVADLGGGFFFVTYTLIPLIVFGTLSMAIYVSAWAVESYRKTTIRLKARVARHGWTTL